MQMLIKVTKQEIIELLKTKMKLSDSIEIDLEIEEPSAPIVVQSHETPDANGWYLVPSDWPFMSCPNKDIRVANPRIKVEFEDGGGSINYVSRFDFDQSRKICKIVSYKVIG